jgi:hypothetical protein
VSSVIRFALTIFATLAFICIGLWACDADAAEPGFVAGEIGSYSGIRCPYPTSGAMAEIMLEQCCWKEDPSTVVAQDETSVTFKPTEMEPGEHWITCVNRRGEDAVAGKTIRIYVPEADGMLPVGLVALTLIGRWRR